MVLSTADLADKGNMRGGVGKSGEEWGREERGRVGQVGLLSNSLAYTLSISAIHTP